jgi:cytochrome bd-type quinol oxidase subunit 2
VIGRTLYAILPVLSSLLLSGCLMGVGISPEDYEKKMDYILPYALWVAIPLLVMAVLSGVILLITRDDDRRAVAIGTGVFSTLALILILILG